MTSAPPSTSMPSTQSPFAGDAPLRAVDGYLDCACVSAIVGRICHHQVISASNNIVHRVETETGESFAVKILTDRGIDLDFMIRCNRELSKRFRVPNVVHAGRRADEGLLIMEFVEGKDLASLLATQQVGGALAERVARYLVDLADACQDLALPVSGFGLYKLDRAMAPSVREYLTAYMDRYLGRLAAVLPGPQSERWRRLLDEASFLHVLPTLGEAKTIPFDVNLKNVIVRSDDDLTLLNVPILARGDERQGVGAMLSQLRGTVLFQPFVAELDRRSLEAESVATCFYECLSLLGIAAFGCTRGREFLDSMQLWGSGQLVLAEWEQRLARLVDLMARAPRIGIASVPEQPAAPCQLGALRKPQALAAGDAVGVFSPAFPFARRYEVRFWRSIEALRAALGVQVVVPEQALRETGFTAGSSLERAAALNALLASDAIRMIVCSIGGFNSSDILRHVDWSLAVRAPKIICGYSDCTALLLAAQAQASLVTFYGPALMPQFGDYPNPMDFTLDSLRSAVVGGEAPRVIHDTPEWTNEFLDWAGPEWLTRARATQRGGREIWRQGFGEGALFGGNIETLNFALGTPYVRVPERLVLFWESTGEEASLPRLRRALIQLENAGILERTCAMLIGRSPDAGSFGGVTLRETVLDVTSVYDFPIIANLPFGHTDPMLTLPLGCRMKVEAVGSASTITLQEPGVIQPVTR
jgi:muramoyltetrapeptide carboxypeptidase